MPNYSYNANGMPRDQLNQDSMMGLDNDQFIHEGFFENEDDDDYNDIILSQRWLDKGKAPMQDDNIAFIK